MTITQHEKMIETSQQIQESKQFIDSVAANIFKILLDTDFYRLGLKC